MLPLFSWHDPRYRASAYLINLFPSSAAAQQWLWELERCKSERTQFLNKMVGGKGEGIRTRLLADDQVKAVPVVSEAASASGNGANTTRNTTIAAVSTSAASASD